MQCPSCHQRTARRRCPALGTDICPVCCGTKRQVEIACPDDCVFLSSARSHPAAVVRRQQERDLAVLLPVVHDLTDAYQQLFFILTAVIAKFAADGGGDLSAPQDSDVADAVGAMASTLETAVRGVLYEHQPNSLPARRLVTELKTFFTEFVKDGRRVPDADAALVLRRIQTAVNDAQKAANGDAGAFLDIAARVARQMAPSPARAASRIIAPGSAAAGASSIILP